MVVGDFANLGHDQLLFLFSGKRISLLSWSSDIKCGFCSLELVNDFTNFSNRQFQWQETYFVKISFLPLKLSRREPFII